MRAWSVDQMRACRGWRGGCWSSRRARRVTPSIQNSNSQTHTWSNDHHDIQYKPTPYTQTN